MGNKGTGKTTRLLETVMWLKAVIVVSSNTLAQDFRRRYAKDKRYNKVVFVSCTSMKQIQGRFWDIICVDDWRICIDISDDFFGFLEYSLLQPIFTERLDTDQFDIEVLN